VTAGTVAVGGEVERVRALAARLREHEAWGRGELLAYQRARLEDVLRHAVERSPYYREALGPAPDPRDLERFPTLPKSTLMAELDRIVTDPVLRRAELEAHEPGALFAGRYRVFRTSGTTGEPALVVFSQDEFAQWVAVGLRAFAQLGLRPEMRLAPIGAPSPLHLTRRLFAGLAAGRERPPSLFVTTPLTELVETLNEHQPDAMFGYASIFVLLAQEQLAGRLTIAPEFLAVGSEVLSAEGRAEIAEAWGIEPGDVYASTEVPFVATRRPGDQTWEVCDDQAIVEVVDEDNRRVPPGEPGHKLLVTSLVSRAQPLIRYELSDSVVAAEGTAPGRPWARLARIDGRSDDILRLPARGGGLVPLLPYRLREPFGCLREVRLYQVVYDGERLVVRVVLQPWAPAETAARVRDAVSAVIADAGAVSPVGVVPVDEIEREPGHAAKLKFVKRVGA
jgi:phenylacetate-CoA ligase